MCPVSNLRQQLNYVKDTRSKDLMYSIFSESIGEIGSNIQNVK
jgi:hypothetical protein